MGIELPGWLRWVGDMIGEPFPEGDETACRRQADRWRQVGDQLQGLRDDLDTSTQTALSGFGSGAIHDRLDELLKPYGSSVEQIASQFRQLADAVDGVATEIEFAKEMFIANLVILAAAVTALLASIWINWTAPAQIAAAVAVAEAAISQVIRAAISKVASEAVARVIGQVVLRALEGAAANAVMSGALNAGIQSQQILQGNRHVFDVRSLGSDMGSGAIAGAVVAPILRGAHGVDAGSAIGNQAKMFGASFVGNAGGTLAAQQAMTGHVNFADALGAGLVFGGVDGLRRQPVNSTTTPELTGLTGDRPGAPAVEPLPAALHQQTPPVESSLTVAGHSPEGISAPPPNRVDVPLNLGPPGHEAGPLAPAALTGPDTAVGPHPSTPANGGHPGITDTQMTGSSAPPAPPTNHSATSTSAGSPPATTTSHAAPATGNPQVPAARAGLSDAAAAPSAQPAGAPAARGSDALATPAAHTREFADPHSARDAEVPARDASVPRDTELSRDAKQPRDAQPTPLDSQAPRDGRPSRDAQPSRDQTADPTSRPRPDPVTEQAARQPGSHHDPLGRPDDHAPTHPDSGRDQDNPGDRGREVASHHDADRAQAVANEALWKRIPPVRPDELRHHLADKYFGDQRATDNAAWWRELSGDEQRALIDTYAREMGNAEGIPAWARTEANHNHLSQLRDELQARRDAGERLSRKETKALRRYDALRQALDNARARLAGSGDEVHVLAFDPHAFGGDGRMVVSVGNDPYRAEAVSWHVPGYSTTIDKLQLNLENAMAHLESVRTENPAARVSSIAWIGYDAPQGFFKGIWDVAHTRLASAGGNVLHGDLVAFNAARDFVAGDGSRFSNNDIFGHSYGSTTTSFAGHSHRLTTHARSVTLLGSPGAGPLRHASEFGVAARVFVAASSRDFVTMLGGRTSDSVGRFFGRGLGFDPAMQAFGAYRITAEFPRYMDQLFGTAATHSAYYRFDAELPSTRTESLANFGRIGAGHFEQVHIEQHRVELPPSERGWPRTTEPSQRGPLENHDGDPADLRRRIWDPRWHSDSAADPHRGHPLGSPENEGLRRAHEASAAEHARCAHDVSDFLAQRYGRDVSIATEPGPTGVPARDLFEACGSASRFATYAEVHDALLHHGDGAAAVLASRWAGDLELGGHAYVAVNEGGTVHLHERVGDRFERSGWPPAWGERATELTAVGYLDRHGNPIEALEGSRGELDAADTVGDVAGERPHASPLTEQQRDEILGTPKGERPDPEDYLSAEFIEEHLARFDDGATRYMVLDNLRAFGIGQRDGTTFVFPSHELDALTAETGGDLRLLEQALGLPEGYFEAYDVVRVDIADPASHGLRMPSGNEAGANDQWLPGGFLPKGMPEAVIDGGQVPPDDYTVTEVSGPAERRE